MHREEAGFYVTWSLVGTCCSPTIGLFKDREVGDPETYKFKGYREAHDFVIGIRNEVKNVHKGTLEDLGIVRVVELRRTESGYKKVCLFRVGGKAGWNGMDTKNKKVEHA